MISISKSTREQDRTLPSSLLSKIKVHPPPPKHKLHSHYTISHISTTNGKNKAFSYDSDGSHHPSVGFVKESRREGDDGEDEDEERCKRSIGFKEKLVEFLIEERNRKMRKPESKETAEMLLINTEQEFFPRQHTNHGIWNDVQIKSEQQIEALNEAFYKYFLNAIKSTSVASLGDERVRMLIEKVPKRLSERFPDVVQKVVEEVKEDYCESLKVCNVNYILVKPTSKIKEAPIVELFLPFPQDKCPIPSGWRESFLENRSKIEKSLHVTNIAMGKILQLWVDYENIRLIVIDEIYSHTAAFRISGFRSLLLVHSEICRYKIYNEWYLSVLRIFHETISKQPHNKKDPQRKLKYPNSTQKPPDAKEPPPSLFSCANALIYNHLRSIVTNSLSDYISLFDHSQTQLEPPTTLKTKLGKNSPRFVVRLWLKDMQVDFDPMLVDLEEAIIEGLDYILKTVESVPKVESILDKNRRDGYKEFLRKEKELKMDGEKNSKGNSKAEKKTGEREGGVSFEDTDSEVDVSTKSPLDRLKIEIGKMKKSGMGEEIKVLIESVTVKNANEKLKAYANDCFEHVRKYTLLYDEYIKTMYGDEVEAGIEQFFKDQHSFEDFTLEIEKYRSVAAEIMRLPRKVELPMIELNCDELHKSLSAKAIQQSNKFLDKIIQNTQSHQKSICQRYEIIQEKALHSPENFKELAEQMEYMDHVKNEELPSLVRELETASSRLMYIINFSALTEDHITMNNVTFTWPQRIEDVLDRYTQILGNAREKSEANLRERRTKFVSELDEFAQQVEELKDVGDLDEMPFYVKKVTALYKQLQGAGDTIAAFNKEEALFGWNISVYPQRKQIISALEPYQALYTTAVNFQKSYKRWMDGSLLELDSESIEAEVDSLKREIYRLLGTLVQAAAPQNIAKQVKEKIDEFMLNLPIINIICNHGMRDRHWAKMSAICEFDIKPDSTTSLRKMLKLNLEQWIQPFQEISDGASKEFTLERNMKKMFGEWENIEFSCLAYRETGTFILAAVDEIQQLLDDQIVKTQSMRGSPFIKPFEQEIKDWERKLLRTQETVDEWLKVQATWLYLEPIFGSEDIMNQMPEEGRKFKGVDHSWRKMMTQVMTDRHVMKVADIPNILEELQKNSELLEQILKGLNSYLEVKRLYFPRFFFLSNDEMLEILSETKDPKRVQPHLKKCFEGVASLDFDDKLDIHALFSSENERLALKSKVSTSEAKGSVERWLGGVEKAMLASVQSIIDDAYLAYPKYAREKWVLDWPGQVVLCVSSIFWTSGVEKSISLGKKGLSEFYTKLNSELSEIIKLVRGNLTKMARSTLGALVVIDVHARDVVSQLIQEGVKDINDFGWLSQLRYYWENTGVMVKMINAQKAYGNEYLGNSPRLVITPLTDRCYRTLFGALHLNLGGAPEGPAGTGKTETTKDLAKALAKQCVVFNCSDGLDYLAMGKFFKGLASAGAWACFDEFNRIDLEVLSVVAQQILTIQRAIAMKADTFLFEGTKLTLNPTCAVFITMNPGYAGRSELPDNLKALFRTVAMMVPDYTLIAEISLYSFGFIEARNLARKIAATYRLCSEQLSSQDHYDYGMRAVKSVLTAAGNLKLKYTDEDENILVLRSIIDVNLPKFLSQDIALFRGIASDLFPGVTLPKPDYELLEKAIEKSCQKLKLQNVPTFVEKIIQLYEMMLVRHGYMLVGETFSGKTSAYRVLSEALTLLATEVPDSEWTKVQYKVINPKSIPMGQLYGQFDPVSHEWTDGVLAVTFRNFASSVSPDRKWVIFDGPVDAIWIENMNTVLDDNKKLCLMSGEIIQLSNTMSLVFEVGDLAVASPATVSRCGMVFMEPDRLGWKPLVQSWLEDITYFDQDIIQHLYDLFIGFAPNALAFVRRECKELSPTTDIGLVNSLIRLLDCALEDMKNNTIEQNNSNMNLKVNLESKYVFALVWSVGGSLDIAGQIKFNNFLRQALQERPIGSSIPNDDSVYDYMLKIDSNSLETWVPWLSTTEVNVIPAETTFNEILIPTKDTVRYSYLLSLLIQHNVAALLVGPTGTGKSKYITNLLLSGLPKEKYIPLFIAFSARTSSNQTQDIVMSKLDKRRKSVFGPPVGKQTVIFIDDLNVPSKEVYGAQPPIELFRQWCDHGNWYDRKDSSRLELIDVQLVGAMGPPGGGRNSVTPRFLRHFNQISINAFDHLTMNRIFTSIIDWHFGRLEFSEEIRSLSSMLIKATGAVYNWAIENLLPTPAKTHYTFNLRDFSRVVQGLVLSCPKYDTDDKMIRLWFHEVSRVYYDRLICDEDRSSLFGFMIEVVKTEFGKDPNQVFEVLAKKGDSAPQFVEDDMRSLMFGDYVAPRVPNVESDYVELTDLEKITSVVQRFMEEYNNVKKAKLNLVLFRFAIEHVSRLCRVLKLPGGHALLVGVGGSGRQSLTRLAGFICNCELLQIEISKSYGRAEWKDDLKRILVMSGADNFNTVFLFTDTQIKEESFIEDISSLLNSGDVPNLFAADEKQTIIDKCMSDAAEENKLGDGSSLALYNYFIERVKRNLHIILCMSPIGDAFRGRLRQFSALVNCCTINWFQSWPDDALQSVAYKFLQDVDLSASLRESIVYACQYQHQSVVALSERYLRAMSRHNYVTPTSYLELLNAYKGLFNSKQEELMTIRRRYIGGLDKLQFAAEQVSNMQRDLSNLQPQLKRTSEETSDMLIRIEKESVEVEATRTVVAADEAIASEKAEQSSAIKQECEANLAEALPLLNAALSALDTLKKNDIDLVKSMKNPPDGVKLVMEAVCVMKDIKPEKVPDPSGSGRMVLDYWKSSLKMLGDAKFLDSLKAFDKDDIPPHVIKKIRATYLPNPEFRPEKVRNASSAAEGLCNWIIAMEAYDRVAKVVAPKQIALAKAEEELAVTMTGLQEKRAQLKAVLDRLQSLRDNLQQLSEKKERLIKEVKSCEEQLDRAQKLLGGLGGEKQRWTEIVEKLDGTLHNLPGDILLSAGVIAYQGAFTKPYRLESINEWITVCKQKKIPCTEPFSLSAILGDPIEMRAWNIAGLPSDSFSIDNGIIVKNSRRWPLMIDPQGQANKWIKNMEKDNNLQVIKLTDSDYIRNLENAITFGAPVLIENVKEELDPVLDTVLQKQTFKSGGVLSIRLGDAVIEYSENFRLYITTKMRNPHYLPELQVKVSLLNFSITSGGLEDQLLGIVVAKERPELEEEKTQLILQSAENKKKLKEIEDKILEILSTSEGNILENETAIEVLSSSKVLSVELFEKQKIAEETEKKIDETRDSYRPIANHSSTLFFCIAELANIDPMYQYSLNWFVDIFLNSIAQSTKSSVLKRRLKNLETYFTYSLYCNVCRSLFEKDKLLFSFLLTINILQNRNEVEDAEFQFLITGGLSLGSAALPNPDSSLLSDKAWTEICLMSDLPNFRGLKEDFKPQDWKHVFETSDPYEAPYPGRWNSLDGFQKLLMVRTLRPEKMVPAIMEFVKMKLGHKFIEPPTFDLAGSFEDSTQRTPLIFILSPGVDPMAQLLKFAEDKGMGGTKIQSISLGQGQGPIASAMIKEAQKAGTWVVLQNCHLAVSWMLTLEKIADEMMTGSVHKTFRLWLTSYPSDRFPVSILQNSVKMTNEAPKGLRANLMKNYLSDPISDEKFFTACKKTNEWERLVFGLCYFHALVQERRNFGPLGWNIPYEFNESDLRISMRQLQMFLDEYAEIPFKAILYLTGECNYGGRVTDDWDRRTLNNVLTTFYNPQIIEDVNYRISPSGTYGLPTKPGYASYLDYIKGLPLNQSPEVFGIHDNGDIARQLAETKTLFDSVQKTQERVSGGGGGKSTDEILMEVASDILSRIPPLFDIEAVTKKYPVNYHESMNTVLVQEMIRYNKLMNIVLNSLVNVKKAIKGLVVMSADLEEVCKGLLLGKVPAAWAAKSYPSLKPLGSYVLDLVVRIKFFQKWEESGAPVIFWMSGFFFTPSFITATLQNYARKRTIPIDELTLEFEVLDSVTSHSKRGSKSSLSAHTDELPRTAPEDGVYVHGIFLEGARWNRDRHVIGESFNKVLYDPLPVIWFKPAKSADVAASNATNKSNGIVNYVCPVYKTSARRGVLSTTGHSTNYVLALRIPSDKPEKHWILRGVAAL
ncbi:Dynein heavy chain 7, axonemal [Nowakowskiella sp. JEL0407]|nr:Dynein heavy chain 7, axonemal [Nowakowskiella sp. JEL0407]